MTSPRVLAGAALLIYAAVAFASCAGPRAVAVEDVRPSTSRADGRVDFRASVGSLVPPPLQLRGTAYEAAADVVLPDVPAGNYPGLHNVFRLSDSIISGSEPFDEEALSQVAAWGVKTILSVDGKAPAVETAQALGMRYVHVPLQYKGITDEQLAQITKTFHELEAPFFVHCFHGKHRGPTAAAIGRVALDGLSRDRAIAEMRQWCATAEKYESLYSSVATADIPTRAQSASLRFDFTPAHEFDGFREVMIGMTRLLDEVKIVRATEWQASPEHPDVDPLRSATMLAQLYAKATEMEDDLGHGEDFSIMMAEGKEGIDALVQYLTDCRQAESGTTAATLEFDAMEKAYQRTANSCLECHSVYRN